jgi:hypothetical protein
MPADTRSVGRIGILLPCASIGFLIFYLLNPTALLIAGAVVALAFLATFIRWPEAGTLTAIFLLYTNIAVLAMRPPVGDDGASGPRTVVALTALWAIMGGTLAYQVLVRKQTLLIDRGFMLMLAFLAAVLASALFARDPQLIGKYIADYLIEGVALYFLVINVIRDYATLRRVTWVLLLAGALMSSFSVLQKLTHTEDNTYGGFAQLDRGPEHSRAEQETIQRQRAAHAVGSGGELVGEARSGGPVNASNEYAGILIVLLPLAVMRFRTEKSRALQALAVLAAGLIFAALLLTLSRGTLLAVVAVVILMTVAGLVKVRQLLIAVGAAALLIAVFQPSVITRMLTLGRINSLFSGQDESGKTPDSSVVLRYELDVAAWRVFLDHPLFGVGPSQFATYYSIEYVSRVGLQPLQKGYQAHNLYFQALAETGLVGFTCFVSIMATIMWGLWKARGRVARHQSELALTAAGFFFSLTALSLFSIFSHLIDQRYFWLLFALSSAATRIILNRSEELAAGELSMGRSGMPEHNFLRLDAEDAYSE